VVQLVYPIFKRTVLPIIRLFLKEVKGTENISKKGPYIITANHESYLDPFLICSVITPIINKKIHFLAVKGRFWDLWGDKIARDWGGCVCLDYGKEKAFQELLNFLKKGEIVGIFTSLKSLDGNLKKGKTGIVRLALKAQVPILPIGIIGSFDIAPGDKLIPHLRRAKLHIGKPIYLDKYYKKAITGKLLRKLTDDVMHIISKLTGKPYTY
jgi:1-acyl-sn-glycerol-3-phosphate acyltransferase